MEDIKFYSYRQVKEDFNFNLVHERFQKARDYWRENFENARKDVEYISSYQEREVVDDENRLRLTFNLLPQFINRVVGGQRQSVFSISVYGVGSFIGKKEPMVMLETGKQVKLSVVLEDLIRGIEYNSNATDHYKIAFKQALEGGFSFLRIYTEYEPYSFNLVPKICVIKNRWSVLIDPDAIEPDLSDMNWAFIFEKVPIKVFRKMYPEVSLSGFEGDNLFFSQDYVIIAEYFERVPYDYKLYLMSDGSVVKEGKELRLAKKGGLKVIKERKQRDYKVIWRKITHNVILEGPIEFPSRSIPIIPMFGRITYLEDKLITKGLVNDTKNTQDAINRIVSSALETIDLSPISPFIATSDSIAGFEKQWQQANVKRYSVLVYNKGEEPPRREPPAPVPAAQINMMGLLTQLLHGQTGIYAVNLGAPSLERTGIAIRTKQQEGDLGTFEFIDNYAMAIRRIGKILIEIIPRIYDTNRVIMLMSKEGNRQYVEINKVMIDPISGNKYVINRIDLGNWEVRVDVGKSYTTKKLENAEQIIKLMQYSPQVAQLGADLLVKNLDFADADVLAKRLEKAIPLQYLSDEQRAEVLQDQMRLQKILGQSGQQQTPEQVKAQLEQMKAQLQVQIEQLRVQQQQLKLEYEKMRGMMRVSNEDNRRKNQIAKAIVDKIQSEPSQ